MPQNNHDFWTLLVNGGNILAGILAFALSYLRILYDDKEPRPVRRLLEALLGGLLVYIIGMTCEAFGLHSGWSYAAAGFVGVLGVDQVRQMAQRWANRKAGE